MKYTPLVSTPRLIKAPGNGFSGNVNTFDAMPLHSQISMLCDLVSWKKIQPGYFFVTKPSLQDGHGRIAKNTHSLEVILNPEFIAKFQDGRNLGQSLKQKSYSFWKFMELKFQFHQQRIIPEHLGY